MWGWGFCIAQVGSVWSPQTVGVIGQALFFFSSCFCSFCRIEWYLGDRWQCRMLPARMREQVSALESAGELRHLFALGKELHGCVDLPLSYGTHSNRDCVGPHPHLCPSLVGFTCWGWNSRLWHARQVLCHWAMGPALTPLTLLSLHWRPGAAFSVAEQWSFGGAPREGQWCMQHVSRVELCDLTLATGYYCFGPKADIWFKKENADLGMKKGLFAAQSRVACILLQSCPSLFLVWTLSGHCQSLSTKSHAEWEMSQSKPY